MAFSLEPKVTLFQALTVTGQSVTLGSMKTRTQHERDDFSKRLNQLLDKVGAPPKGKGRQGWLAAEFKVTQKGARKWLEGEAIPTHTRLSEMAKRWTVDFNWLATGQEDALQRPAPVVETSKEIKRLIANFQCLTPAVQAYVLGMLEALAAPLSPRYLEWQRAQDQHNRRRDKSKLEALK